MFPFRAVTAVLALAKGGELPPQPLQFLAPRQEMAREEIVGTSTFLADLGLPSGRRLTVEDVPTTELYRNIGSGTCVDASGAPAVAGNYRSYLGAMGSVEGCRDACNVDPQCMGYEQSGYQESVGGTGNCKLFNRVPSGVKDFHDGWGGATCYVKQNAPSFSIAQDGAVLRVRTKEDSFTGAEIQLVYGEGGSGGGVARHFGGRLIFSGSVSGVFIGRLQDEDFPHLPKKAATALADPERPFFSGTKPKLVEELGWDDPRSELSIGGQQDSELRRISLRFASAGAPGAAAALEVGLHREGRPSWVLTNGLPSLGDAIHNGSAHRRDPALGLADWTALANSSQMDGFLGLSLWRELPSSRNFLDDLLDAVGGKELHVGGFLPRNGTAWWKSQTPAFFTDRVVSRLSVVPTSGTKLEEWTTQFDSVWTLDPLSSGKPKNQVIKNVKVIVDPGPQIVGNGPQILLPSDLFNALNASFGGGGQGACDRLPSLVFTNGGSSVFRLTSKTMCACVGNTCTLKVGDLGDVSPAVIRLGSAIAQEYDDDAYFLSYRGVQQPPELVVLAPKATALAFPPPSLTAAVQDGSLTVNLDLETGADFALLLLGTRSSPGTSVPISLQASQTVEEGLGIVNGTEVLPLGLLSPTQAARGEKSYLQRLLDHARALDPLADSVNFLYDSSGGLFKFSYRLQTSVWSGHNGPTEPALLGAPAPVAPPTLDGSVLSLGPAQALPGGGGWALSVFTEDAFDVFANSHGGDKTDLFDSAQELLLQAAGQTRFTNQSRLLAIDYGSSDLVVPEADFQRVTQAWERILKQNGGSNKDLCPLLKTTIKLQLATQRLCGLVSKTGAASSHGPPQNVSIVEPKWCDDDASPLGFGNPAVFRDGHGLIADYSPDIPNQIQTESKNSQLAHHTSRVTQRFTRCRSEGGVEVARFGSPV